MTTKYFNTMWCDGPGCQEVRIYKESGPNPTWWNLSYWAFAEKTDNFLETEMLDFDFCSLKCLEEWCRGQRSASD